MSSSSHETKQILKMNHIIIDDYQWELLEKWEKLLIEQNQKLNLISRSDIEHLWQKHILHSLSILTVRKFPQNVEICDLGTGGGLPGIALAITLPNNEITMLDSIQKKIKAVNSMILDLSLNNAHTIHGRAEMIAQQKLNQHRFPIIVVRAVSSLSSLEKWTRNLRSRQSVIHAYKGGNLTEEINTVAKLKRLVKIEETLLDLKGIPAFSRQQKKIVSLYFT